MQVDKVKEGRENGQSKQTKKGMKKAEDGEKEVEKDKEGTEGNK